MSSANVAAEALSSAGVARAFVVGSNQNLKVLDALLEAGIDCRPSRCEVGAVHSADGHARAAGARTVAVTSTGPGAGNAVGAFCTAAKDGVPVVHLTTTHFPGGPRAQGVHTILEQGGWLQAMGAPVMDLARGTSDLDRCLRDEPGALTVVVPDDDGHATPLPMPESAEPRRSRRPFAIVEEAVELWLSSDRRVLWIGGGARSVPHERLQAVASRSGAAVVTTVQGKDLIPGGHAGFVGCTLQSPFTRSALEGADSCLVLGSRLSELSTAAWASGFPRTVVRAAYSDEHPPLSGIDLTDHPVAVEDVIGYLDRVLPATSESDYGRACAERRRALIAARGAAGEEHAILAALGAALGSGDVMVCDMTKLAFWAVLALDLVPGARFLFPGMLNMGFGLPAAIGAAHARPASHVVLLTGDGGLLSVAPELDSLRDVPGRVSIVLIDDDGYGLLRPFATDAVSKRLCTFAGPDWAALAHAFHIDVVEAHDAQGVHAALSSGHAGVQMIRLDGRSLCAENWRTA